MTHPTRRAWAALPFAAAAPALAQEGFPRQPVRLIMPFAAGTGSDTVTRIVAHEARNRLSQPRPGRRLRAARGPGAGRH